MHTCGSGSEVAKIEIGGGGITVIEGPFLDESSIQTGAHHFTAAALPMSSVSVSISIRESCVITIVTIVAALLALGLLSVHNFIQEVVDLTLPFRGRRTRITRGPCVAIFFSILINQCLNLT